MAVSVTNLTQGGDTVGGTSINTASISPAANKLILVLVATRRGDSTEPSVPTISGCGLTWVNINSIYWDTTSTSRRKLSLFRAMGSSPSSGALTITFGGDTVTNSDWIVDQISGMDTSGTDGSGAIVQSATNKDESITTQNFSVTLAAFSDSNNATYGGMGSSDSAHTITPGSGFTETAEQSDGVGMVIESEFRSDNSTTVNWVSSGALQAGGIAIEIKAAVAASTYRMMTRMMMGMGN